MPRGSCRRRRWATDGDVSERPFEPAYLRTCRAGRMAAKVQQARAMLRDCRVCPRDCRVNRWRAASIMRRPGAKHGGGSASRRETRRGLNTFLNSRGDTNRRPPRRSGRPGSRSLTARPAGRLAAPPRRAGRAASLRPALPLVTPAANGPAAQALHRRTGPRRGHPGVPCRGKRPCPSPCHGFRAFQRPLKYPPNRSPRPSAARRPTGGPGAPGSPLGAARRPRPAARP